ncbi:MAG: hypothetical protein JRF65_04190 [Deltaproteobacteria bacterium]|nr:hypothetical protein [Deltaproteobacteria bacterium]
MKRLKPYFFSITALAVWLLCASGVQASWFIDERKFHISAHGQTACVDCHDHIQDLTFHPDPHLVDKKRIDFFRPEACLDCHDGVTDDLAEGLHGSKTVADRAKYRLCIRCHKPHFQRRLGENRMGTFKPGIPRHEQCGACHEPREALPAMSEEDEACMGCHRLSDPDDPQGTERISAFCLHCHGAGEEPARVATGRWVRPIHMDQYDSYPHADIGCTVCHPESPQYGHAEQQPGDCLDCHQRHHEKAAHDAHLIVACGACHLKGVTPVRETGTGRVVWKTDRKADRPQNHDMTLSDDQASCRRCHAGGNKVGAVDMVLPPKSILCMPCHAATFSVGDTVTVISLLVFLFGMVMLFSYWLSGSVPGAETGSVPAKLGRMAKNTLAVVFSTRFFPIVKTFFLDVLLQRGLYRRSPGRWFIHGLVFYPFLIRFTWGFVALCASRWAPDWGPAWSMIDKNHPVTGFLFDLTGIMVMLGIVLLFVYGALRDHEQAGELPRQDRKALCLMAGVVLVGFLLEGIRIGMTGRPPGSGYAFVGYAISFPVSYFPFLTAVYGVVWYAHAILTGAFIAYLPFSRLLHIIMAPLSLALNAVSESGHKTG